MSGSQKTVYQDGGVTYTLEPISGSTEQTLIISYADGSAPLTVNNVAVLTKPTGYALELLNFSTYFIPPGVTTTVGFGLSAVSHPTLYVAGNVTVTSGASLFSSLTFYVTGPSANLQLGSGIVSALCTTNITLQNGGAF